MFRLILCRSKPASSGVPAHVTAELSVFHPHLQTQSNLSTAQLNHLITGVRTSHLQRGVEHHQFGAGWDDVVTLVTLHEAHVDVALRLL